jgi:hypothetical protein
MLRFDVDRCADSHQFPDLVHLCVGYCNTPIRPVIEDVRLAHPRILFRQTVEHNIALDCASGSLRIPRARVRNVEGLVELALGVTPI